MESFDEPSLSDVEGEEFEDHKFTSPPTEFDFDHEKPIEIGDPNLNFKNFDDPNATDFGNLKVPKPKEGWEIAFERDTKKFGKEFVHVDNPGGWHPYSFTPKFTRAKKNASSIDSKPPASGQYLYHSLPTGAIPVPKDTNLQDSKPQSAQTSSDRVWKDWCFHYRGFTSEITHRHGSSRDKVLPEQRKAIWDIPLLESMKLDKGVLERYDSLFILQLFLPICDPKQSGIEKDPRHPSFSEVSQFTNTYASQKGMLGGNYGKRFSAKYVEDIVRYFGLKL